MFIIIFIIDQHGIFFFLKSCTWRFINDVVEYLIMRIIVEQDITMLYFRIEISMLLLLIQRWLRHRFQICLLLYILILKARKRWYITCNYSFLFTLLSTLNIFSNLVYNDYIFVFRRHDGSYEEKAVAHNVFYSVSECVC